MKKAELTLPEIALIAGTRGMLGAGVGLLLADRPLVLVASLVVTYQQADPSKSAPATGQRRLKSFPKGAKW